MKATERATACLGEVARELGYPSLSTHQQEAILKLVSGTGVLVLPLVLYGIVSRINCFSHALLLGLVADTFQFPKLVLHVIFNVSAPKFPYSRQILFVFRCIVRVL